MTTDRDRFIADLHEAADFLASHPAVPLPYLEMLNAFCETREELATVARCATWTKDAKGGLFLFVAPLRLFSVRREYRAREGLSPHRHRPGRGAGEACRGGADGECLHVGMRRVAAREQPLTQIYVS